MTRKVLHFHIPKTGGTAVRKYLEARVGADRVTPHLANMRLRDALLAWDHLDVVSGHFSGHQGDHLPRERLCVTALREPVDRFLSEFYFLKNHSFDRLISAQHRVADLDEYLAACNGNGATEICRQLNMLYPFGAEAAARLSLEQKVVAAQAALDRFDLVGTHAELDDLMCMLEARTGWSSGELQTVNATAHRMAVADLTSDQRCSIERLLEAEIAVYQHARKRFRADRRRHIRPLPDAESRSAERPVPAPIASAPAHNFGDKRCEILSVEVRGSISSSGNLIAGETAAITLVFVVNQPVEQLTVGIAIRDERGALVFGTNSLLLGNSYALGVGRYAAAFSFLNRLGWGHYSVDVALHRDNSHHDHCHHWWEGAAKFEVQDATTLHFQGRFLLDAEHSLRPLTPDADWRHSAVVHDNAVARSFGQGNEPLRDFRARLELMSPVVALRCRVDSLLQFRVHNPGGEIWPAAGRNHAVALTYRWYRDETLVVADGLRSNLREDLQPGKSAVVPLLVRSPEQVGRYRLCVSLVQECVAWFVERVPASACWLDIEIRDSI